jgi:glycosyltransferase involved in cell wall biosynthesis
MRTWDRRARSFLNLLRLVFALIRQVRRFRPSVIHAHSSVAGVVVRLLYGWRRNGAAIVYCPHGWAFDRSSGGAQRRLVVAAERALARWCDAIVAISRHDCRRGVAIGIPEDCLHLVLNGIADNEAPPPARWNDNRIKVLFVGRLDRQKGFDTLLDAVQPLESRVVLRVIGRAIAGPASERRVSDNVTYLGWRSLAEVSAEIAAADVVVVPSRWEGFGLVALEAMRGGRAVVASAIGGLPEVVEDGVTGRLVVPDAPLELMLALSGGTRETWQAMGRAGRDRFLRLFTARRMARELSALYKSVGRRGDPSVGRKPRHAPSPGFKPTLVKADA